MWFIQIKNVPLRGLKKSASHLIQVANITGRATRGGPLVLPKGFDYENKKVYGFHRLTDSTMKYISQENAKIIVVEGPIGVGKTACAKILAEQLDMKYIPQATLDDIYVLPTGFDIRQLDKELPVELQSYDHKNFCVNPKDNRALLFQLRMLYLKFFQYVDATAHLLNTGQGVVLERSYYSDFVFAKSMYEHKYISKTGWNYYNETLTNTKDLFIPPHLIIYLDIPVETVQERICKRNYSYEQNSPALTKEYLESLDTNYKQGYLRKARETSEILVYNWKDGGDADIVIEDIEKIDFDVFRPDDRFREWRVPRKVLFALRQEFSNNKYKFINYFWDTPWKVPELFLDPEIQLKFDKLLQKVPDLKYDYGYNPLVGDNIFKILLKTKKEKRRNMRDFLYYYDDEI